MALSINPAVSRSLSRWGFHAAVFLVGSAIGVLASYALALGVIEAIRNLLSVEVAAALAVLIVAIAIIRELGVRVPLPYRVRQVPEGWRGTMPVWGFSLAYGIMLGFGFLSPYTYSTHLAMLLGLPFVSSIASVATALLLFAVGKTLVLFATLGRNVHPDRPFESRTTRFGIFTLHVTTVGVSLVVLIALSLRIAS